MLRVPSFGVAICALLTLAGGGAFAQTTSSTLTGSVRTLEGKPVPDAAVQARSDASGAVRSAVTGREGRFRIDLLSPGSWTVVARAPDGQASESRSVTLRLQETVRVDFTVGKGLTEKVTVRAEAPLIDPHRTGGELRVQSAQIDALPLSGRVVTDLALLDASVRASPPGNFYGERGAVFVVNGQSGRANSFLVDGLDNNDQTSGTTLNAFFSQQVIREFVVQTHQYASEFGRASGGVLNIITQQGSNDATAEAFLQGTRGGWNDPGSFVSSLPHEPGRQDAVGRFQSGFKVGGPIQKDRSFYFAAYEHQQTDEVIPFTGVDRDRVAGGWMIAPSRDDNLFLRTDFNLTPSQTLMVRLSGDDRTTRGLNVGGTTTPESGFRVGEKDAQIAASLTSVISSNLFNEARLLAGSSSFRQFANSDRPGVERPSGTFGGNNLNRQLRDEGRVQIVDNMTWSLGRHTMKFGVDLSRSRTRIATRFNPSGNFLYDTDAPFEPGDCGNIFASQVAQAMLDPSFDPHKTPIPCPGTPDVDDDGDGTIDEPGFIGTYPVVLTFIEGKPKATLHDVRLALFAQDSWQIGSKWILDYGLRYDLSTFRLPDSARVRSSIPNGGAGRDRDNFGPRAGFSFTPFGDGILVIRGGAGIFYDKIVLGFPAVAAITSGTEIGLLFPQGLTFEITEDVVEQLGTSVIKKELFFPDQLVLRFSTGTRLDTPYTEQFSLGAEQALGPRSSLAATVLRAQGYHQILLRDLNPPVGTDAQGIPVHEHDTNVGSIAAIVTEGRSWYTGVDLGWKLRGKRSWSSISYTWSEAYDLGPDPLKGGISLPPDSDNIPGEVGRSDADRRHRLVISGESPLRWMGLRASGVLQLATGAPFDVTTGRDENLDGITSDRPPGVERNTGAKTPLGPINALRREADLPPVHKLREPRFAQLDLRLSRPFAGRGERVKGEAFFQVFNLLDRFNGGPVDGRVTSRHFGEPVGLAGPPRTLELGMKMGF